ncbi:ABC transporter permease [Homoserinibacter sp. YIM 151385]|uniref:ABC transporter permease n=1 Tax=Homoserinibacter sp. YIM 151385 TaxID=2985506 RepID=UPI0022F10B48|nr:ABC transporter permease subunit [Homoserinibacter sp. YIM 151385]WBU38953.1 ABC transporter permease subunit [Homoserinibacter sp. YIM 151385]
MNLFLEAFAWLTDPARWGDGRFSIPNAFVDYLFYTFVSVLIAALIAIPLGYLIGHTGRGRELAVGISGAARALPSFGLILLLVLMLGVTRTAIGAVTAFVILAIPSILAGAYAGIEAVDRRTVDAARAVGMTEWQILWKVEVPLGLPLLVGGLRSAVLQVVATVALAGFVNLGGFGYYIIQGLQLRSYDQILAGALLIIVLALVLDAIFGIVAKIVEPRGLAAPKKLRTRATRPSATADPAT